MIGLDRALFRFRYLKLFYRSSPAASSDHGKLVESNNAETNLTKNSRALNQIDSYFRRIFHSSTLPASQLFRNAVVHLKILSQETLNMFFSLKLELRKFMMTNWHNFWSIHCSRKIRPIEWSPSGCDCSETDMVSPSNDTNTTRMPLR